MGLRGVLDVIVVMRVESEYSCLFCSIVVYMATILRFYVAAPYLSIITSTPIWSLLSFLSLLA